MVFLKNGKTWLWSKKENEQVWNEFRAALNKFYGKKREFFGDLKKTHKTNKDKKLLSSKKLKRSRMVHMKAGMK